MTVDEEALEHVRQVCFRGAQQHVWAAIQDLVLVRTAYEKSDLPERAPRIKALEAKIDALQAVRLNPDAYPWITSPWGGDDTEEDPQ